MSCWTPTLPSCKNYSKVHSYVLFSFVPHTTLCSTAGGRNFLFVNVPPIDRSPLVRHWRLKFPVIDLYFFFLIQMLAQDQSARDAESLVINNFNTKLVAKISSFKSNNTGVNSFLLCWPFMCVSGTQYMIYSLGLNLHLGLSHPIHHDFGLSHYLWVWRCHVLWEWI